MNIPFSMPKFTMLICHNSLSRETFASLLFAAFLPFLFIPLPFAFSLSTHLNQMDSSSLE